MTVIDVVLHKWRMLDERRRKIIIGFVIIAILLSIGLFFALRSMLGNTDEKHHDASAKQSPSIDAGPFESLADST